MNRRRVYGRALAFGLACAGIVYAVSGDPTLAAMLGTAAAGLSPARELHEPPQDPDRTTIAL